MEAIRNFPDSELVEEPGRTHQVIRYGIAVAASVILIAAGIWVYNFINLSSNKVFASNYHSYELSNVRGPETEVSPIENAYRNREYKKVTELWETEQHYYANEKDEFLAAISYVELKENPKAIDRFKKLLAYNDTAKVSLFKYEAEYYLALTYIRDKDYDFALDLLRTIKENPQHTYYEKVTNKLIRQVKLLKWR